ncbi:Protein of unknown function DUF3468 [Penicillium chermesinum]|nr:Protein of unknown function DUF3468 [Penicillium chermesinum]
MSGPPIYEASPVQLLNDAASVQLPHHREALEWYTRSMSALQRRIDNGGADLTISLISCILFIAIELLQGNRQAALALTREGAKMMTSVTTGNPSGHGSITAHGFLLSVIKPIFRRLSAWVYIKQGGRAENWGVVQAIQNEKISTLVDARNVLCSISAEMKSFNLETKRYWCRPPQDRLQEAPSLIAKQAEIQTSLTSWYSSFLLLSSASGTSGDDGFRAYLLMTYLGVFIEIQTLLDPDQASYDAYEAEFAQIIKHAPMAIESTRDADGKQPPFTFEMGVFFPLFITALNCRIPHLRRQALRFLWDAPPAQGLFLCGPAANIVAMVVALEEDPTSIADDSAVRKMLASPGRVPPSENRIWEFGVFTEQSMNGSVELRLQVTLRDYECEDGEVRFKQKILPFPGMHSSQQRNCI